MCSVCDEGMQGSSRGASTDDHGISVAVATVLPDSPINLLSAGLPFLRNVRPTGLNELEWLALQTQLGTKWLFMVCTVLCSNSS